MEKRCNKYEGYFIFANEEEYRTHLQECEECRQEEEKAEKLSKLIKDSANTYRQLEQREKTKKAMVKTACALLIFSTIGIYTGFEVSQKSEYSQFMKANTETSVIAQEGLPVDEFGFFDYN